jgi:hypothetical protein
MDSLLRNYIDKQNNVYKLRIAIKHKELKKAKNDGSDERTIKEIQSNMVELVKSFKGWKQDIKKRFEGMSDEQVCKHFYDLKMNLFRSAQRICLERLSMWNWKRCVLLICSKVPLTSALERFD